MHIPDGYLSPATCAALGGAMVPAWLRASQQVKRVVKTRYVPLVAIAAAYSFLVMMFNVPVPDGTTAHAVGAVLIAVLLGPWAAVIAISIALLIQALFFGDGGVLAFGANAFNMALVMPFAGYGTYRVLARGSALTAPRRAAAAGIGGYVGLNLAALCAAIEFGLQPELFHSASGVPLYAPFHLSQTIPAMALAHLTVAGFVELAATAGVVAYLQRTNVPLLRLNHRDTSAVGPVVAARRPGLRWAVIGLAAMVVASPLGLLASGGAFGESAPGGLDLRRQGLRAVPNGLARYNGFWRHTVLGGYGFDSRAHPVFAYVLSAVLGVLAVALVALAVWAVVRLARRAWHREAVV